MTLTVYGTLVVLVPLALGVLLAVVFRVFQRGRISRMPRRTLVLTLVAALLPLIVHVVVSLPWFIRAFRSSYPEAQRFQFVLPLLLGILAVALLSIPGPRERTTASAGIAPRKMSAFLTWHWPAVLVILAAIITAISVAAGSASSRDEQGRFRWFIVELGSSGTTGSATEFYGWFHSVPALIALAVLLFVTAIAWMLLPRPPWNDEIDADAEVRRLQASNIGRATCGAMLVHLGGVLGSLGMTADMGMRIRDDDLGTLTAAPPFAALGPTLSWLSFGLLLVGAALWTHIALTAVPAREHGSER